LKDTENFFPPDVHFLRFSSYVNSTYRSNFPAVRTFIHCFL